MKAWLETWWFVVVATAWAVFASAILMGLCAKDAHALVGASSGEGVVVIQGDTGTCYKAVKQKRPFDRLYKSQSMYRYNFIDVANCSFSSLRPESVPNVRWSVMPVGDTCYEVMKIPLQTTVGLYPSSYIEWEQSWGVELPCN